MASLDMNGPYPLNTGEINLRVQKKLPGAFALGIIRDNKNFVVKYLGHHPSSIRDGLIEAAGKFGNKYGAFKYSYAMTAAEAKQKFAEKYREFGGDKALEKGAAAKGT